MMRVKKYVASSLSEAVAAARSELGREAFIVDSRRIKVGGIFGLFGKPMIEVTVAADDQANAGPAAAAAAGAAGAARSRPSAAPQAKTDPAVLTRLEGELSELRQAILRLAEGQDQGALRLRGKAREAYERLVARGVDEQVALKVAERVPEEGPDGSAVIRQELAGLLGECAPITARPGERRVVALVGPTGVGKTTTLAKLAARFVLEQGLKVSLITADTYRIAAVDQLRTYAEILGVPLYTVDTPAQVTEAMRQTAGSELVLVDTCGRNHRDAERMAETREILDAIRPDETHLLLSLTTHPRDLMEMLDGYAPLGVNRLTFTKLDEASAPGVLLNVLLKSQQPVSYLTNGQSVPDDLIPANRVELANILMGA